MLIDLQREQLYPLRIAVRFAPPSSRTGKTLHTSALVRWAKRGLLAGDGSRVYLEVAKAGASLATSREALDRFFLTLTSRAGLPPASQQSLSSGTLCAHRPAEAARVERELDKLRI